MTIASRLLNLVRTKSQQELSRYFLWHPGKSMVATKPGSRFNVDRARFWGWMVPTDIRPDEVPELQKVGWRRSDFTRPALLVAARIINERLRQFCRPMLTMDHKDASLRGYWTASNLLGCIWLQLYLSVIGQLKLRRCTVCGCEMDVSDFRRNKRVHDRCSKNSRQARWRANLKLKPKTNRQLGKKRLVDPTTTREQRKALSLEARAKTGAITSGDAETD